jgi:hypothetical protein
MIKPTYICVLHYTPSRKMTDSIAIPQNVCLVFWASKGIVWICYFCISQGNSELGVMLYFPCVQFFYIVVVSGYSI